MQRVQSFDLARGFTVLFITPIHTGMLYASPAIYNTVPCQFLIFIAEGPGGQLLMLLMGISATFSKPTTITQTIKRATIILLAGYGLNLLKFVTPHALGLLPHSILEELQINPQQSESLQLIAMGDILHFAAPTLIILHLLKQCKHYPIYATILATLILLTSPLLYDLQTGIPGIDYIIGLATGKPPQTFFPLLPWLVYPLSGMVIGYYYQRNLKTTMQATAAIGLALITGGLFLDTLIPIENPSGFYRTPPAATAWHLGIALTTLAIWHVISTKMKSNAFFRLLTFSSRHITMIYLIQWILICWALPVFGYQQLDLPTSLIIMLSMTINTYALTLFIQLLKKNYHANR